MICFVFSMYDDPSTQILFTHDTCYKNVTNWKNNISTHPKRQNGDMFCTIL